MSPLYSGAKIICRCLQITETDLLEAVDEGNLRTIREVVCKTGAGDGCTACRKKIVQYLEQQQSLVSQ